MTVYQEEIYHEKRGKDYQSDGNSTFSPQHSMLSSLNAVQVLEVISKPQISGIRNISLTPINLNILNEEDTSI